MPAKWQILIYLGQQTILDMQKTKFNNRSGTVVNKTVEYRNRRPTGCEDMPRKSIDIRFSDYPILLKRGYCTLFLPSGEDGCGQSPQNGSRDTSLVWVGATPQGLNHLICNFQGSMKPIFLTSFFHISLDTPHSSIVSKTTSQKKEKIIMRNNLTGTEERIRNLFKEEKLKTLKRYKILNEQAQKGKVLFTSSSLMEQFPINEMLMTENIPLTAYNRGVGGFTTDDMLAHMDEMVFGTEPSVIFINIGTNGIGSSDYELDKLMTNYEKILNSIKKRLGNVKIYLIAYYPVNDSPDVTELEWVKNVFKIKTNENINKANKAVEQMAERMDCRYIDLNEGLTDWDGRLKKEFTIEGIHMYPNGYKVVFENLIPYLREWL